LELAKLSEFKRAKKKFFRTEKKNVVKVNFFLLRVKKQSRK